MGRKKSKNNKRYRSFKRCKVLFEASPEFFPDVLPKPTKAYAITEENESAFLKYMGLWGARKKTPKTLFYKGVYTDEFIECRVVGFAHLKKDKCTLIVEAGNKQIVIISSHLVDMQNKNFKEHDSSTLISNERMFL